MTESDDERDKRPRVTTRVDCADYFAVRDDALRAHATQIDPDGFWFRVPLEVQRASLADRGLRAGAVAGRHHAPEDDLFAGVRETQAAAGAQAMAATQAAGPPPLP